MTEHTVAVLGSTGSIGTQTLEVCALLGIGVTALCAGRNIDLLEAQARQFRPAVVGVADTEAGRTLRSRLADLPCRVVYGAEAAQETAADPGADVVVTAMTGTAGLLPTMAAVREAKRIALANKETLVCAGRLVMAAAARHGAQIVPVDSEHSAIFQSMDNHAGVRPTGIKLTASGGPFRGLTWEEMRAMPPERALKHPNWSMGAKVTIDSATMMNKGLELIEAMHLFGMAPENIEILVHPQSIVHSAVEYADGAVIAQMGTPDMRLPIQYALTWPERLPCPAPRLDLAALGTLTFERPDLTAFRCLRLAVESAGRSMSACCAMNAANEIAVNRYLRGDLSFGGIYETAAAVTEKLAGTPADTLEEVLALDAEARRLAAELGVT
ncbi:MAG: 1-deoxy-D-xylulose-5-phosphate reductoisomerase [Oscillospiraceae bacterium]|nr:1-deoxy-D-xylulose-5-phosphate reductoisomerase [Oscillospiraceae bacterium]